MLLRVAFFALALHLSLPGASAQAAPSDASKLRLDTPSGYPVPRFLSLKDDETNCRIGPSFDHPVRFVFKRAGAPVLVVAESVDHWRKVRDPIGDECWVHQTTLKAQTHVLIVSDTLLFKKRFAEAAVSARLGAGVLAKLSKRKLGWLYVAAGDARGWTPETSVWGGDPLAAPPDRRN